MDKNATWQVIHRERAALADLLESLTPQEWDAPSLCDGWRVREVAGHVVGAPETSLRDVVPSAVRARGRYNRMILEEGRRQGRKPPEQIVADLRRLDGTRKLPPFVTHHEALLDTLVHTQDIAIPLGRHHEMPREAARDSVARFYRFNFSFGARRKLRGTRLEATDVAWSAGKGAVVRGPVWALLLLVTGRPVALGHLSGEGVPLLRQRFGAEPSAVAGT